MKNGIKIFGPQGGQFDFLEGGLMLFDKPKGWTSFDVVNKVRFAIKKHLGVKNIKVGHAGTLDPMATGLLLLCTGKMTKQIDTFQGMDKVYIGTMHLGATTPSYDAETEPDATFPTEHITAEMVEQARTAFTGAFEQAPPMYSAIKVEGQPLYKKARKGEVIEVKKRPVIIYEFVVSRVEMPEIDFTVKCSKGTYIRSLAYDVGAHLGSGAYLSKLHRVSIGDFNLNDAWQVDAFVHFLESKPKAAGN